MIFDTHAHYDDERFNEDRYDILNGLKEKNVYALVNVGANMKGSRDSIALSEEVSFVYASVGVHPDEVGELSEEKMEELLKLSDSKKCVAIGEIGLDYYESEADAEKKDRELQKKWFMRQMELAAEKNLPIIVHSRDAAEDTMKIVKEAHERFKEKNKGIIHCFSYSKEIAEEYVKLGFYIGIGGVATFKNGKKMKEVIASVPMERIVTETDCPYLAPEPHRGTRNTSDNIQYVIKVIADIKGLSVEETERIAWNNALDVYEIKDLERK